jgi:class 3 adenylate cyclase/tetratricopeptide (TPR) repeat protein
VVTCAKCGRESQDGFEFCPSCGASLKPAERAAEERKLVSVLFADVIGSTDLGERLDPERLRSVLEAYFSAMSAAIASWGGTVEKFIGDAVMAVFGAPVVREDDAARALQAALEMLSELEALNREFLPRHGVALRIRIGVNTGEVIAPTGKTPDQTIVTGDAVNIAARLEQAAEPGTVLVGERTYLAARNAFRFGPALALDLKGKSGSITAYPLQEALPEASRGVPGLFAPMVGRDRELDALASLLEEAIETNRPRLVTVYGPAGIGKSRLVQEFVGLASARFPEATVLKGRCPAVGHGITYWALGEILRAACGIALDDSVEVAGDRLRSSLRRLLSVLGLREEELDQTVFALATTAGISLAGNPLERMEPRAVAEELGRAWPRFAGAYASRGPLVIVMEDLHWAEDRLLEMLERVLARSSGPLVMVATARPEFAQSHPAFAAGREDASSISLRPLTEDQGAQLVDGLLSIAELPSRVRTDILGKAEGNPFFLEEIIRRLIDEGGLVREGDRWRATAAARTTVLPDTVHGLLAARIDGLPPREKRVLQEAAVMGRVFWQEPVAEALRDGDVSDALLGLERKGLLFARPGSTIAGQVEYMFKHALVRDVAYASLPKARRARAHAEHGAWIERLAGERLDEFAELLAYHYVTAAAGEDADLAWADDLDSAEAVRRKALESLLVAGKVARQRFAIEKAIDLHDQALSLSRSDRERGLTLEELGDDHAAAFHGDEAVAAYLEALTLRRPDATASPARARLCQKAARMSAEKAGAFRVQPEPSAVEELLQEGLAAAEDDEARAWLLALSGASSVYWRSMTGADPVAQEARIDAVREGLALAESLDQPDLQMFATRTLAELYEMGGAYELAVETTRRQLALLDRIASATERALTLFSVSAVLADLAGEYDSAIELSRQSYALARDLSPHERMHALYGQMKPLYHLGRWEEVLTHLEEHLEYYRSEADVTCFAVQGGPMFGALTLARMGHVPPALELGEMIRRGHGIAGRSEGMQALLAVAVGDVERGRSIASEVLATGDVPWRAPESALAILEALAALGDWGALTRQIASVRRFAGALAVLGPACDRAEGLVRAAEGDADAAVDSLRRSLDAFERLGERYEAARTKEAMGSVSPTEKSHDLFVQCLREFEELGARPDSERVKTRLGTPSDGRGN